MFTYKEKSVNNKILFVMLIVCITFFFILFFVDENNDDEVIISEICSHNKKTSYDYFGETADYIELYNPTNNTIDLSKFYVSDSDNCYLKYKLPSKKLLPKEYYVIYLSKNYSEFELSDFETLYLYDGIRKKIVEEIEIPALLADQSYSKNFDDLLFYVGNPTPGTKNFVDFEENGGLLTVDYISVPASNYESGFYNGIINIELTSDYNTKIFYTLDSSEPSRDSFEYKSSIQLSDNSNTTNLYSNIGNISTTEKYTPNYNVNKCVVLRAIAVDENGNKSKELIKNYYFDYEEKDGYNNLNTLSIVINPDELFDNEKGIYVLGETYNKFREYMELKNTKKTNWMTTKEEWHPANYRWEGEGSLRDAHIIYFDSNGNFEDSQNVKLSIHGFTTRNYLQKSFNIFKKSNENSTLFSVFNERGNSLLLRNGGNAFETHFDDPIKQMLIPSNFGVLKQDYKPVQVFINGEYWGSYNLRERIDKNTISYKTGIDEEDILLIKADHVVNDSDDWLDDFISLKKYISENDMSNIKNFEFVSSKIDIDSYIDYKCFEIYNGRLDGTTNGFNNVGVWKSKVTKNKKFCDGKYRFIVYDVENTNYYDSGNAIYEHINYDSTFSSLMNNGDFNNRFITRLRETIEEYDYKKIEPIITENIEKVKKEMVETNKRFINPNYSESDFSVKANSYYEFYKERGIKIINFLDEYSEKTK